MSTRLSRFLLFFALIAFTVGCDQITKAIARVALSERSLSFFGEFLRFQHAENPGAFLSLGADLGPEARFWVFTIAVILILGYTVLSLWRKQDLDRLTMISLSLIVAGGLGNLIDRVVKGTVTDFMIIGSGWLRTGVFNIADMAIVAGVVALAFKPSEKKQKKTRPG